MQRSISFAVLAGFAALAAACGGGTSYSTAGRGPALGADARIDVNPSAAGNRQVHVSVENLLPPQRLGADLSTYSVWIVPPGGAPIPAGHLEYDPSSRRGHLTTVTPYENFRVLVTAEPARPAGFPSGAVVITQDVTS